GSPFDELCAGAPRRATGSAEPNQRSSEPSWLSEAGESCHDTPGTVHYATGTTFGAGAAPGLGRDRHRPSSPAAGGRRTAGERARAWRRTAAFGVRPVK